MTDRPILFNGQMIRAILAGTKTQTRRVVNRIATLGPVTEFQRSDTPGYDWIARDSRMRWNDMRHADLIELCPYGQPGDRLWVKEQTIKVEDCGWVGPVYTESEAGQQALEWGYGEPDDPDHIPPHAIKRRPSLFMSRAMSRITLEITDVRVERPQDISEADAIAEGIERGAVPGSWRLYGRDTNGDMDRSPRVAYRSLWESINGDGSWDANPWVWVVEFRRITP